MKHATVPAVLLLLAAEKWCWDGHKGLLERLQIIPAELESDKRDQEDISRAICRHRGLGSVGEVVAIKRFPTLMAE